MFVVKQFVLPAAPAFPAPAAAPTSAPPAPAIAAAKVAAVRQRSSSMRAAKALRAGLSGLGCACQQQAAARRKAAALGSLGFSWKELFAGAGIGAGADALKQFLIRPAKPVVTHSVTYPNTRQDATPPPQVTTTPAGSPPPLCPSGYQSNGNQCVPASAAGTPAGSPPSPSWFGQQTIIHGVSNGVIVAGGTATFLLLAMYANGRRRH